MVDGGQHDTVSIWRVAILDHRARGDQGPARDHPRAAKLDHSQRVADPKPDRRCHGYARSIRRGGTRRCCCRRRTLRVLSLRKAEELAQGDDLRGIGVSVRGRAAASQMAGEVRTRDPMVRARGSIDARRARRFGGHSPKCSAPASGRRGAQPASSACTTLLRGIQARKTGTLRRRSRRSSDCRVRTRRWP